MCRTSSMRFLWAAGGYLHEIRWTDGDRNRKGNGTDGGVMDPADGILRSGDYIEAINRTPATDKERYDTGGQGSGKYGSDTFSAPRGRDDGCTDDAGTDAGGDYKLGLWIRDDTQGISTMTYVC